MTIIVYEPDQLGEVRQIDGSMTSMQEVVGGYIRTLGLGVPPGGDPSRTFVLIVDEDAQMKGAIPHMTVGQHPIAGTSFVAIMTAVDIVGLTNHDVELWKKYGEPNLIRQ
jgi:hypothetical protein